MGTRSLIITIIIFFSITSFGQKYQIKRIYLTGIEGGLKASGEIKISNESILVYYEIQDGINFKVCN
jgi:hypothetical protein